MKRMDTGRFYLLGQRRHYDPALWNKMSAEQQQEDVDLREGLLAWCQSLVGQIDEGGSVTAVEILDQAGVPGPTAVDVTFDAGDDGEARDLMRLFPLALSRERRRLELLRENSRPTLFP